VFASDSSDSDPAAAVHRHGGLRDIGRGRV
jgi:hypothetical protein